MRGEDEVVALNDRVAAGSPPHARGRRPDGQAGDDPRRITPACAGKTPSNSKTTGDRTDHPRMRGEDSLLFLKSGRWGGSPPHARGRLHLSKTLVNFQGITPACAGKTRRRGGRPRAAPDHPRMRGEDLFFFAGAEFSPGSPPHARGRLPNGGVGVRPLRDHPRMRGEDPTTTCRLVQRRGSPPHARGRRAKAAEARLRERITPACAGKTFEAHAQPPGKPDHPRMRGEDIWPAKMDTFVSGSPPHARGRRNGLVCCNGSFRITPACAGKTKVHGALQCRDADHPRMRGEDVDPITVGFMQWGSPPHARGRHPAAGDANGDGRITPACAGKTGSRPCRCAPRTDHPRMRGEDTNTTKKLEKRFGSPPHARGRRAPPRLDFTAARITPACAGKTWSPASSAPPRRDHPRMRGEDPVRSGSHLAGPGSPPHARGRRNVVHRSGHPEGITPACAGKTSYARSYAASGMDHPRMRGEDNDRSFCSCRHVGSPPHARGRLEWHNLPDTIPGITPACAGKTPMRTLAKLHLKDHPRMRGEDW